MSKFSRFTASLIALIALSAISAGCVSYQEEDFGSCIKADLPTYLMVSIPS